MPTLTRLALIATVAATLPLGAQQTPPPRPTMTHAPGMQHTPGMEQGVAPAGATQGGQAAFAAIQEVVKLLEADPKTDWSKVDLEALRQHLIDMDAVTLRARVKASAVAGGLAMDVTGPPEVAASITRMLSSHGAMLETQGGWRATTAPIAGGMRFTVVAANPNDPALVARIRGLGFIGLMVQGDHHTTHHLAIARGAGAAAHAHGAQH